VSRELWRELASTVSRLYVAAPPNLLDQLQLKISQGPDRQVDIDAWQRMCSSKRSPSHSVRQPDQLAAILSAIAGARDAHQNLMAPQSKSMCTPPAGHAPGPNQQSFFTRCVHLLKPHRACG
jgi:hypothetical protein